MNAAQIAQLKRLMLMVLSSMAFALVLYIAITYLVRSENPPPPAENLKVVVKMMQWVALATFGAGMLIERVLLSRAKSVVEVNTAVIASAAIGEAVAVYGLLVFFMTHERQWLYFGASGLYFLRLFLRLPEFFAKMDSFEQ